MREFREMRVRFDGDAEAAKPYLGIARTQLGITKNLMNLGGLQQGSRAVTLSDGTVIKSQSMFGQDMVTITPVVRVQGQVRIEVPQIVVLQDERAAIEEAVASLVVVGAVGAGGSPNRAAIWVGDHLTVLDVGGSFTLAVAVSSGGNSVLVWQITGPNIYKFDLVDGLYVPALIAAGNAGDISRDGQFIVGDNDSDEPQPVLIGPSGTTILPAPVVTCRTGYANVLHNGAQGNDIVSGNYYEIGSSVLARLQIMLNGGAIKNEVQQIFSAGWMASEATFQTELDAVIANVQSRYPSDTITISTNDHNGAPVAEGWSETTFSLAAFASGISDSGNTVVGYAQSSNWRPQDLASYYDRLPIPPAPPPVPVSGAVSGIYPDGLQYSIPPGIGSSAVSWQSGVMSYLPSVGANTYANKVSADGRVVVGGGTASEDTTLEYGRVWEDGVLQFTMPFPGVFWGVSPDGESAAGEVFIGGRFYAAVWKKSSGMSVLPSDDYGSAEGVLDGGQIVVGTSQPSVVGQATVWVANQLRILSSPGWTTARATDVVAGPA